MKHRWGSVEEGRPNELYVYLSYNKGDEGARTIVARWLGITVTKLKEKEWKKLQ